MSCLICFLFICIICQLATKHIQSWNKSLYCSRTCTKWAYKWHIFSVNAQTRLNMHAVFARAFTALTHTHNGCVYGIFYQSVFKQALACVQPHQSLHCSRTCAKWAYIPHILSVNAQTSLIVCVVFLLPHMHEIGVHMTYFSVNAQTKLSMHAVLPEHSLLSHIQKMGVFVAYFISQCSNKP